VKRKGQEQGSTIDPNTVDAGCQLAVCSVDYSNGLRLSHNGVPKLATHVDVSLDVHALTSTCAPNPLPRVTYGPTLLECVNGESTVNDLSPLEPTAFNVGSPMLSQLNAHPSDVVPIQRDVAVTVTTIQHSTDTASSGSITQPCDVVSTVCDVVTTLCPLDVTNAGHISSTVQAHHCNPHGEFSNMETASSLNHSVVVTPNKAGKQHGTQFACVDATGLFSCAVSCATYRFRFLLGDMVWNEVLSYIKVPSCCAPARTKSSPLVACLTR
jgi:hypothetical protein